MSAEVIEAPAFNRAVDVRGLTRRSAEETADAIAQRFFALEVYGAIEEPERPNIEALRQMQRQLHEPLVEPGAVEQLALMRAASYCAAVELRVPHDCTVQWFRGRASHTGSYSKRLRPPVIFARAGLPVRDAFVTLVHEFRHAADVASSAYPRQLLPEDLERRAEIEEGRAARWWAAHADWR